MRLSDFILANTEAILVDWESFARDNWPGASTDVATLRDHASDILHSTALDMRAAQTGEQRKDKSIGRGGSSAHSDGVARASVDHATGRLRSGFDVLLLIAEYRALRASVLRLWRASKPVPDPSDIDDITRFNESIDQSLADAVGSYTQGIERSRQMFLAILGHDLRNPLASISLIASVIPLQGRVDPPTLDMLRQISASSSAMSRIIDDLLDFAGTRLGGGMPLSTGTMDLVRLCDEVIRETRSAHRDRPLEATLPDTLEGVWDATRMRQVVSNLLGNAIQHGDAAAPVTLTLAAQGDDAVLSVHNEGPPIPADRQANIFDPLVRDVTPDVLTRRRAGSIGLGLYIAREVVQSHGGTIEVASQPGTGTTFTVRLPRRRPARR